MSGSMSMDLNLCIATVVVSGGMNAIAGAITVVKNTVFVGTSATRPLGS